MGYDFFRRILGDERRLLVRVGSNVRLLRKLGFVRESRGTVYLWTSKAARKDQPPLVLRLVVVAGPRHPVYLLTSLLDKSVLSDREVGEIYRRRWGVELFYRHLKQTFGRRKLRSTSATNAAVELEWSLVGLWGLGLSAALEMAQAGIPPGRTSMAGVLRTIRRFMRDYLHPLPSGVTLSERLRTAQIDRYVRVSKSSRDYPRKRRHERPGEPTIQTASLQQIQHAQMLRGPRRG